MIRVHSSICAICQQALECPMQRTILSAEQATDERLIAPRYLMQISAQLEHVTLNLYWQSSALTF